jgi:prepilin-type N-terminal cleavage/methylation domain-containing protein
MLQLHRCVRKEGKSGFTLIEILFVIAILGVIFAIGLAMTQKHTEQFKVEKTALQIQQLLQAAAAYYVDNACWPNAPECKTSGMNVVPDFNQYIPVNGTKDPWGNIYTFTEVGDHHEKFQVSDNLLYLPDDAIRQAIATRVAALLPNASGDGGKITSEVSVPGYAQGNKWTFNGIREVVIAAAASPTDVDIPFSEIKCPNGWSTFLKSVISAQSLEFDPNKDQQWATKFNFQCNSSVAKKNDSTGDWDLRVWCGLYRADGGQEQRHPGAVTIQVIEMCKKD